MLKRGFLAGLHINPAKHGLQQLVLAGLGTCKITDAAFCT